MESPPFGKMNSKKKKTEQLTKRIAKLRKAIRKKYKNFKTGETEAEIKLEKHYKPLVSELKKNNKVTNRRVKQDPYIKKEEEEEMEEDDEDDNHGDDSFEPAIFSSPTNESTLQKGEKVFDNSSSDDEGDVSRALQSPRGQLSASQFIDQNFQHRVTKKYMAILMGGVVKGRKDPIDHTYGPRFDNTLLKVGDSLLQFDEDGGIRIRDVAYKGTEGLYELLFKRIPDGEIYNDNDMTAYKDILVKTNAHKKNYEPQGNVNRNNSLKYRDVISKLFPPLNRREPLFGGTGLSKTLSSPDPIYWDDPNELVERLRLLVASAQAGNTGVKNEILNILEELREAGFISGGGNRAFKALLR